MKAKSEAEQARDLIEFELLRWFENFALKYKREPKPRQINRAMKRIVRKLTIEPRS
jgi:hypothetical protein